jgi:hypothetical protein
MEELSELFKIVSEEKKKKKLELESLVGDSFEKLFIEQLQPKKKKNIPEKIQEPKIVEVIEVKKDTLIEKSLGLLSEPSGIKHKTDPLTPLDQKFATLEDLNKHYSLFLSRIQQQLSTLGGGGETRLRYLDDVVGIATNSGAYNNKFLQWNSTTNKAEFVDPNDVGGTTIVNISGTTNYYHASNVDDYIGVNANVPVTIVLPTSPNTGKKLIVKDEGNKIATYNITVQAGAGTSVENDSSVIMTINHQSFTYFYNGSNWFLI